MKYNVICITRDTLGVEHPHDMTNVTTDLPRNAAMSEIASSCLLEAERRGEEVVALSIKDA